MNNKGPFSATLERSRGGNCVEIVLQQDGWTRCRDILSNENLPIRERSIPRPIPMGTLRIVDLIQE